MSEMHCRVVIYLIALATTLSQIAGELFVAPRNTESKIGDTTYFNCSTDLEHSDIFWHHGDKDIYTGNGILEPYRGRFEIDRTASVGSQNLVIHSVESGDAGEYICADDEGYRERLSAQLIVLDNDPDCQSNIQPDGVIGQNIFNIAPDEVQLTCTVTYHGNIPPQLEWRKVGDVNSSTKDSVTSNVTSNNRLIYTLKLKGDISLDNSSYVCQTTRSTQSQYKCTSEIVKVLYFISGNMIEENVIRGGEITCTASNSTFPCNRQWYQGNYTCPLSCDETIIAHVLGAYLCMVRCIVRGKDYSFEAMKIVAVEPTTPAPPPATEPSPKETIIISVVVTVVVTVVVVGVLIFVFIWFVRKRRDALNRKGPVELEALIMAENDGGVVLSKITPVAEENHDRRVRGLTVLDDNLFVTFETSNIIEAFPISFRIPYRKLMVDGLMAPGTIAACVRNSCIYVMDQISNSRKKIFRIKSDGKVINNWETDDDDNGRISVSRDGNVVMTVYDKRKVKIYLPDGILLTEMTIDFSGTHIIYTFHCINLADGNFIIGHGIYKSDIHQVCKFDATGKVLRSFGNKKGSGDAELNCPAYVAERKDRSILVADLDNQRIILLNSELELVRIVFTKENCNVSLPEAMYVYEDTDTPLLFLGCNETRNSGGYVLVLRISQ